MQPKGEMLLGPPEDPSRRCSGSLREPRNAAQCARRALEALLGQPEGPRDAARCARRALKALLGQPEGPQRCCSVRPKNPRGVVRAA